MELTGLSLMGLRTKAIKEHVLIYHNKTSFTVILCLLTTGALTVCRVTLICLVSLLNNKKIIFYSSKMALSRHVGVFKVEFFL